MKDVQDSNKSGNVHDKPEDLPADLIVSLVSKYGSFGNMQNRSNIAEAIQDRGKDGRLTELELDVNSKLAVANLEADYSVLPFEGLSSDHKKYVALDLNRDSIIDGISLAIPAGAKPVPLKENELDAAGAQVAAVISHRGDLGDKSQRQSIQKTFFQAEAAGLLDQLVNKVSEALGRNGDPAYYVAERNEFKDSKGNPLPELVLHVNETLDELVAAALSQNLEVPADAPACAVPLQAPPPLYGQYFRARQAEGTKVDSGNLTEQLTLPNGTVLKSYYTIADMSIENKNTGQLDSFVVGRRYRSQWSASDTAGNSVKVVALMNGERTSNEVGVRSKDGKTVSAFNDLFNPDGSPSRIQCKDASGRIVYDKSY